MASIIQLENISKHYSPTIIGVDDVSLTVEDGEFVTLLGPSGCGKSTLLRMIGGFEEPTAGAIRLADKDVTFDPPYKREVNMVFQDYALFPHMTIGENVAYGLKTFKLDKDTVRTRVKDALMLVGLYDKLNQRPQQLSGGQRQRIALARAIVRRPKVLLLDEPLSALDAKLREQMQIELKHLHEKVGITFIMVTHDQTEALVMSDRVVVMDNGRIAQEGRPQDLYDHPASPYVANFIGTTSFLPGKVSALSGEVATIAAGGTQITAHPNAKLGEGATVTVGVRPEKVKLLAEGEAADNVFEGTISEVIYYGLGLRISVTLADGSKIDADTLLPDKLSHSTLPQSGAPVRLGVAAHNVFVFEGTVTP
ncbi:MULTISPECIES: ABC transporter ATP-binding protein [unclassified Thioclava]|uniref:ABC transporter ATP-binding protein n=1 Tax=unclassified Thioclava TaxID=2621713 RepID=UPI0009C6CA78|nr:MULTISPECIES: ABC transporter ATP-binding protein [unclassified Thioclava]OOY17311.1 Fe3+/spermidine/putrescine ABC transporter ATP-binding protein [Thioclava sp. DLFJ4-1]